MVTQEYGAPRSVWTQLDVPEAGGPIGVVVSLIGKRPSRHAEAMFLKLGRAAGVQSMEMDKLGSWIELEDG